MSSEEGVLETAILAQIPGARHVYIEGEHVFVQGDDGEITRYRLSREAQRVALLAREGRPLDIALGPVELLPPSDDG